MKNTNKGITLIALVITIIVILILVAVIINMAVNGGLFGYAGNAAKGTKEAIKEEQGLGSLQNGMTTDELIEKYTSESVTNPYKSETPAFTWTCTDGAWNDGENRLGDVIAKAYDKGKVTVWEEEVPAYHLVIEKGDGTGEMGVVVACNNGVKVANNTNLTCDLKPQFIIAGAIARPYAWKKTLDSYQITEVIICDGVTSIGKRAFSDCVNLTAVKIPNTVWWIAANAFDGCENLSTITIPNSVGYIDTNAFRNVPNIKYKGTAEGAPWGAHSIN